MQRRRIPYGPWRYVVVDGSWPWAEHSHPRRPRGPDIYGSSQHFPAYRNCHAYRHGNLRSFAAGDGNWADVSLTVAFVPHTAPVDGTGDPLSVASQEAPVPRDRDGFARPCVRGRGAITARAGLRTLGHRRSADLYGSSQHFPGLAVTVTLTAAATCDGPQPLTATANVLLTVASVPHTLTVTATGDPLSVASQGSTEPPRRPATDSLGHGVAWSSTATARAATSRPSAADRLRLTAPANTTSQPVQHYADRDRDLQRPGAASRVRT